VRSHRLQIIEIVDRADLRSISFLTDVETVRKCYSCLFPPGCFAIPGCLLDKRP